MRERTSWKLCSRSFENRTFTVLAWVMPPFFYPCALKNGKSKCNLPGYGSELMEAITQLCGIKTNLIDGTYIPLGKVFANGTVAPGVFTMLQSGEADLTLPGTTINLLRLSFGLLSFSFPIRIDYETYQYRNPNSALQGTQNISINYFSQFKIDVWILIIVSILLLFATFNFFAQNKRPIQTIVRTFELMFSGDKMQLYHSPRFQWGESYSHAIPHN